MYTYDELNRLAATSETQYGQTAPDWRQQFGYDRFGNRAMGTGTGQTFGQNSLQTTSLIGPDPMVSQSNNRITSKTGEQYQFDASGNMTKDALGNRSVYDAENHQTEYYNSTNSGSTPDAKYYYDGDGERIKKVVGAETTIFVYDAAGKMAAEYTLGVTANPSPQTSYLTADALGSPRIATDAAGHIFARHDYLPFGDEILGLGGRTTTQGYGMPDTTRQRFTGYERDTESGLDYAKARYFGNGLGRFTSVNPLAQSARPEDPQSLNRYSYVLNNPLKYVDLTGMDGSPAWESLTQEERDLLTPKLKLKMTGHGKSAHRETPEEAFNRIVSEAGLGGSDPWVVSNVVAAFRNLLDSTDAYRNNEVWQAIGEINGMWSGTEPGLVMDWTTKQLKSVLNYNISFALFLEGGDEAGEAFKNLLGTKGYNTNLMFEGLGKKWEGKDAHKISARMITPSAWTVVPHFVQEVGYAGNRIDVHWDPANSACGNCRPDQQLKAADMHSKFQFSAVES